MHGIGDAIHVADLIAIVRRDGDFGDAMAALEELDDDLCIEMPVGRELIERNVAQCANGIGAVAGMEFRQMRAEQAVLDEGENLVADVLVHRHMPAERCAFDHHA